MAEKKRVKPDVAIVHSGCKTSQASTHLAHYLGGCLALGGFAKVHFCRFRGPSDVTTKAIVAQHTYKPFLVAPPGAKQPNIPAEADYFFNEPMDIIRTCQVVLVCTDIDETKACATRLSSLIPGKRNTGIFLLGRGVKQWQEFEPSLKDQGHCLVEGAVGFDVAKRPTDGALTMVTPGKLCLVRMGKEQAEEGEKYLNLLQTTKIEMLFRRQLTPFTWGTLLAETLHVTNAVTGGTLAEHLQSRSARLVTANVILEACEGLDRASRGGGWAPDGAASIGGQSSLKYLALAFALPDLLFGLLRCCCLQVTPGVAGSYQGDLASGRPSDIDKGLGEIVDIGARYKVETPVATALLAAFKAAAAKGDGVPSIAGPVLYEQCGRPAAASAELRRRAGKTSMFILGVLAFLLFIDRLF